MARRIVLQSPLAPDAVARKLQEVLGDRKATPVRGVTGRGSEQSMLLFVYRPNIQNSFETSLNATMEPAGGGTRIEGKIGPPTSARIFMGCWFGFLTIFLAVAGGGMIASGARLGDAAPFLGFPLAMMAFGALLWRLGTWTGKKDEAAILAFLATTVSARPVGE